jgi:hypothetical protein
MKASQLQRARVGGVVLDASNGKPLSGAQVALKAVQSSDAARKRSVDPEAIPNSRRMQRATRDRSMGSVPADKEQPSLLRPDR